MKKKTILLIGSTGFIGSGLMNILPESFEVLNPDKKDCDILKKDDLINYVKDADLVINCAVGKDKHNFSVNTVGVKILCHICSAIDVPLIQLSSTAIIDKPNTDYGKSKKMSELYFNESKVRGKLIRLPQIYINHLKTVKYFFTKWGRQPIHRNKICKSIKKEIEDLL